MLSSCGNGHVWKCVTSKFPLLRAPVSAWATHDTVYSARGPLRILGLGMLGESFHKTRVVLHSRPKRLALGWMCRCWELGTRTPRARQIQLGILTPATKGTIKPFMPCTGLPESRFSTYGVPRVQLMESASPRKRLVNPVFAVQVRAVSP